MLVGKPYHRPRHHWPYSASDDFDNSLVGTGIHHLVRGRSEIQSDWPAVRQHWGIVLWLGITGGTLFSALQYVGLQHTTALNVSILNSLVPVLIIAAGALIFRDHIRFVQLLGISISLIGVIVIVTHGDLGVLTQLEFNFGDLIAVLAMAVFAIYVAYLRMRPPTHWLTFLFVLGIISAITTMPFAIFEIARGEVVELTPLTILAALYVSTFPSLLAFAAWNRGVELIGPNKSAPFLHLVPLYTALLAVSSWPKTSDYSMWRGCC